MYDDDEHRGGYTLLLHRAPLLVSFLFPSLELLPTTPQTPQKISFSVSLLISIGNKRIVSYRKENRIVRSTFSCLCFMLVYPIPTPSYMELRFLQFFTLLLQREGIPIDLKQQYPIGPFFVDFLHIESKTVIEIDGKYFHTSPEQQNRDQKRQQYIEKQGYTVIRFTGYEVYHYPFKCAARALNEILAKEWVSMV